MLSKKARYSLVALAALVTVVALLAALGWRLISSAPSPRATVLQPTATSTPSSPIAVPSPAAIPEPISVYRGNAQRTGLVSGHGVPHLTGVAWQKQIGQVGFSSPVYADGAINLGTNTGDLLALDAASGEQRWAFTSVGGNAGPAAVAGDLVYVGLGDVGSSGMGLYALNRRTGNQ